MLNNSVSSHSSDSSFSLSCSSLKPLCSKTIAYWHYVIKERAIQWSVTPELLLRYLRSAVSVAWP